MRILIVASGNHQSVAPFVTEQAESLRQEGNEVLLYQIIGHGIVGYIRNIKPLKATIRRFAPDIVHAHYGLSGLLSTLQHTVPVVVTYHGSDLNNQYTLLLSRMTIRRAKYNIFVSKNLQKKGKSTPKKSAVLPCGVNFNLFSQTDRTDARQKLGLHPEKRYILFTGSFDNKVKNAPLAKEVCRLIPNAELLELCNRSREEVALLMNAANVLLVTSHHEGSPQVVKEALACNLPIVSVDVGDIAFMILATRGGIIARSTPQDLATAILPFLESPQHTHAREKMNNYDNRYIASRLCYIYNRIIHE